MNGTWSNKPSRRGLLLAGGAGLLAIGATRVIGCTAGSAAGPLPSPEQTSAAGSTPTAVRTPGPVPTTPEFDLSQPAHEALRDVRLHEAGRSMQGISYDTVNKRLFVAQQRDGRPGADLCINQLSPTGEVVAHLHVDNAGHGQSFGVEPVGSASYLWLECDANENTTNGRGTALARFEFVPGRPPAMRRFFTDGLEVGCAVDPVSRRLLIRRPEGGSTRYTLYDLDQAVDDFSRPLARFPEPALLHPGKAESVLQAFAVLGSYLYTMVGTGGRAGTSADPFDSYLSAIDMNTGEVVQQQLTTAGSSLVYREPEGLAINVVDGVPQLCFGLSSRPSRSSSLRYANVFYQDALV